MSIPSGQFLLERRRYKRLDGYRATYEEYSGLRKDHPTS